ncbi:MAG: YesL family protein [Clostridia bacterium]|nr:YesL family protein [Clostridia bacterium]
MGLFDRFYYGKAGKADYTEMDMPKTRVALFFQVFKERFFDLIKVNFLQIIFWIPFLLWTVLNITAIQSIDVSVLEGQENAGTPILSTMSGYMVMWLAGLIPCILITGPSSAGSAYLMRNWARDQHAFLFSDFKDAFKSNWKQALGVSAMTCLLPFVVYTAVTYYSQMANSNALMFVPMVVVLSVALMWALMLPLLYAMMIGYELSFKTLIKNAFLMAAASLPKMVAARLITLIPIVVLVAGLYIGNGIMVLVIVLYYLLIGFALSKLIYASFANGVFDKYLNPHIEGAVVGQGLRPADADEYFDDDEDDEDEEDDEV